MIFKRYETVACAVYFNSIQYVCIFHIFDPTPVYPSFWFFVLMWLRMYLLYSSLSTRYIFEVWSTGVNFFLMNKIFWYLLWVYSIIELELIFFTCGRHFLFFKANFVSVVLLEAFLSTSVRNNIFIAYSCLYVYSFGVGIFFRE